MNMTKRHLPFAAAALAMAVQLEANAMLEEVVVTATKRQQTLQEIPIAVSVVTAESIEQSQVLDIKDLQTLVLALSNHVIVYVNVLNLFWNFTRCFTYMKNLSASCVKRVLTRLPLIKQFFDVLMINSKISRACDVRNMWNR